MSEGVHILITLSTQSLLCGGHGGEVHGGGCARLHLACLRRLHYCRWRLKGDGAARGTRLSPALITYLKEEKV